MSESGEQGWRSGQSSRVSPPTYVARFRLPASTPYVLRGFFFFFGYSGFPLSLKTNTSKFQFDLERTDTLQRVLLSAPWVNKSHQVTDNNFYSHEN